ncbi:MAG: hypothetical protein KJ904_00065 [Alphaproteobacteria bacterium]|nr:hypothetical protein [Alphaproteobacteria bacterium]MBU0798633.1 hypothetical protein [Alphaproteobacteria bacterium]MBU0885537.1 hypothetical protein [Alphaproteobacteria bacterium]MBU1811885.1 hypothetical protein [Alphaproteobacteria bacterium]MBU2089857.1 hypothetical protein [Alphaproteobacteria bacterium]
MSDNITIKLAGEDVELVPSFKASEAIQKKFGGLNSATDAVVKLSADNVVAIIAIAADTKGDDALKALHEKVYEAGLVKLRRPLVKYLERLGHGGRDPDTEEDEAA